MKPGRITELCALQQRLPSSKLSLSYPRMDHGGYKGIEICCSIYISPMGYHMFFCISHLLGYKQPNSHIGYHMFFSSEMAVG
jgi:hypothetical protein